MKKKYRIIISSIKLNTYQWFNDVYLECIARIFDEGESHSQRLREEILATPLDRNYGGYGGNYVNVKWLENVVYVGDQLDDWTGTFTKDPLELGALCPRAKITKAKLIKLIDDWNKLIVTKPENIVLCHDDNFNLWFETELPDFEANKVSQEERYVLRNPPDDKL